MLVFEMHRPSSSFQYQGIKSSKDLEEHTVFKNNESSNLNICSFTTQNAREFSVMTECEPLP